MAEKMLIFCGSDDPQKAIPPFMLAVGGVTLDMEVTMFFTMRGLNIVRKGAAEKIVLPNAPNTLPEFIDIAQDSDVRMIACSAALPIVGMQEDELIEGVEFGGVATFVLEAQEADVVLTF